MKIVHLCNYYQPQLGYQEYFLAKEHVKLGHDVTIITSDRYFPFPDYDNTVKNILGNRIVSHGKFNYNGIKIIRLKVLFELSKRVYILGLKKAISEIKPDIVVCHGMSNFNSLRIIKLKKKLKFKLIYDDHMIYSEKNKSLFAKIFYKVFNFKKIYLNADKVIGITAQSIDFINENYKIPKEKIKLIPLGADTELFKFNKKLKNEFRKKYNISDKSIVITYTGKLTDKKGPHDILIAIDKIKQDLKENIVIVFVGNFELSYKDLFYNIVNQINIKNIKVIHIPIVENKDLVEIYSGSDIACWPRQATISTIEASSCSLPIICVDYLKERYKNNNGISVKEGDINNLACILLKLIKNPALRKSMGEKGRELVKKEMSWKIIAKKFIE